MLLYSNTLKGNFNLFRYFPSILVTKIKKLLFHNAQFVLYFSYSEVSIMRLFRKKKQSKATVAAEKTEPTLIIEASNIQPKSLKTEILPTFIAFLRDITRLEENTSTKVKSSNVKSSRTVYLISHVHQRLKSYGFIIMNNLKSWLPLFVPLSYYNVVMPKPLRLRHDFITSTTVVAYRLHFLMSIPSKL